jgi:nucleoside-diphosphate-sugar epimerase
MNNQTTIEHVFITGATGCVGHYLIKECLKNPQLHVHVLVRKPEKLKFSEEDKKRISAHLGDFKQIENHSDVISKMDYIIHSVTEWWGEEQTMQVNVDKTKEFFMMADQKRLKQIIYFSTASILGKGNRVVEEAKQFGSDYIKSKYHAYHMIKTLPFKDKVSIVFPTMVFGGDKVYPQSHITKGVYSSLHYLNYIRYIYVDGAFHFIHAADIAKIAVHLMQQPTQEKEYVLGNKEVKIKDAIKILYTLFKKKPLFRVYISVRGVLMLAKFLRIKIGKWEEYCMNNPYMTFKTVAPSDFGLTNTFDTLEALIKDIQILNQPA